MIRSIVVVSALLAVLASCSPTKRIASIRSSAISPSLLLPDKMVYDSLIADDLMPDTLVVKDEDGREYSLLRTIMDENGCCSASDRIVPAYVSATSRNVAERGGMIELCFDIVVSDSMLDPEWQIRITPLMHCMGDTVALDRVLLTGEKYRNKQLRGYQQYDKFLNSLVEDDSLFIKRRELEIFVARNMPQVYAFRNDSSIVSDERFQSSFGVGLPEARDHYTYSLMLLINRYRTSLKDRKYRQLIKSPILVEGIRLDSVFAGNNGKIVYRYIQSVKTRPMLRKIDITLKSEIRKQEDLLYETAPSKPLTFYISSLSSFAELRDRYISKIIERSVQSEAVFNLEFKQGSWEIDRNFADNAIVIDSVQAVLREVYSDSRFSLDSISVEASASPEGGSVNNMILSGKRGESACSYFKPYMDKIRDSVSAQMGYYAVLGSDEIRSFDAGADISFKSSAVGEDWLLLDKLVFADSLLLEVDRMEYMDVRTSGADNDLMEESLRKLSSYGHISSELYPKMRNVRFVFHQHRRGQVKDTVYATVVDSIYTEGVMALSNRDYEKAVSILGPYRDINSAVAYLACNRNKSALDVLLECRDTPKIYYLKALTYARLGDVSSAINNLLSACKGDRGFIHRSNLDPEISSLKKEYNLNLENDETISYN